MINKAHRLEDVKEYYFSKKLREVAALKASGKPIINIAIGSPDLEPPVSVINALSSAMDDAMAHQYKSYQGIPEFREAASGFYENQYHVTLDPLSEILPLMGSKEGILHISMAFLNHGDQVLIPNPGYPTYTSVTKLVGGETVLYDLTEAQGYYPDFESLEKLDLSRVKLMWVNYPHMPTGVKATVELFEKLVSFGKKHQILIVNDNPYSFILNDTPLSILAIDGAKEVALELNSLSKTFNMSGWRVGMLLGAASYLETVLQVKSNMDSGMFYGIQKGAIAAMNQPKEWFSDLNSIYKKRREIVWEILDVFKCTYAKDTAGLFVWAKLPEGKNAEEFTDELLYQKDVFISPGTVFGPIGKGYIRVALCETEQDLNEVLKRIKS
ncbi:MAG: aminotransferase class I/II-fold pyridoxal phosphate-dependent enzyme [Flavobacteriaceae bacterium]|nr:aminotransferase class I/II-fold pyridoxal phosphate-dependent enzyme [Flavobacteriaceae bacterium]